MDTRTPLPALPDSASDEALLARYAQGEPLAARALMERLAPLAYRLALRMLGDAAEAEDVAQDAMLRLWQSAEGWQPGGAKVSTWLYRVAANLATDRLRRRRAVPLDQVAEPADGRPGALDGLIEAERAAALEAAMAGLPERQRLAVALRHVEGLPNPQIADIMGIGVEAVESLTARGRRGLMAALGESGAEKAIEETGDE